MKKIASYLRMGNAEQPTCEQQAETFTESVIKKSCRAASIRDVHLKCLPGHTKDKRTGGKQV